MTTFVPQYYNKYDDDTINKEYNLNRCMCINYSPNPNTTPVPGSPNQYSRCNHKRQPGSHFCSHHLNCPIELNKYLSGYEPEFEYDNIENGANGANGANDENDLKAFIDSWKHPLIEGSHNCYAYFLDSKVRAVQEKCASICKNSKSKKCPNDNNDCSHLKPQPGSANSLFKRGVDKSRNKYKCPDMENLILNDNKSLIKANFTTKCPANYYKGAMVIDPNNTFHFYRQDKDGRWSHKPGITPISRVDASDEPIYIPHFANRNYKKNKNNNDSINYKDFCGYYCIPNNKFISKNLM